MKIANIKREVGQLHVPSWRTSCRLFLRTRLEARFQILVECDSLHFEEAGTNGLYGAETCRKCVAQRVDFATTDHPFQFRNTETADVVVHIVEALTAYTLKDKMPIVAHFLAKTVSAESAFFPLVLVILHPEVDALEAMEVRLVEVILFCILILLGRNLRHLADDGSWQLQSQRLERSEHEVEVQYGEENNVDGQQSQVVEDGDVGVEDHRKSHCNAVSQQVARHVCMPCHTTRKQEDVHDIVDAQTQGTQSQQDVAAQNVSDQVFCRVDVDNPTAHQSCSDVDGKQHQDRSCITPHSFPLQETGHGNIQRIDALKVACTEQRQQHCRVQDARLAFCNVLTEERRHKRCSEENAVYPSQTQVLYSVSCKKSHHAGNDKMNNG